MVLYYAYTECQGSYIALGNEPHWSVQWTVRGDLIDFVVSALTTGWIGIGFSEDPFMVSPYYKHIQCENFGYYAHVRIECACITSQNLWLQH